MKKRIVATLLAGAVVTAGVAGLTACGNGSVSVPKGEEVSKEKWAEAFSITAYNDLENFTYAASESSQSTIKGSMTMGKITTEAEATVKTSGYTSILYDAKNDYAYIESSGNESTKATNDGEKMNSTNKDTFKDYYELKEKNGEDKTYWHASYSLSESKNDQYGHKVSEEYWRASSTSNFYNVLYAGDIDLSFLSDRYQDAKEDKDVKNEGRLVDLYDSFTYANGVYTAKLYMSLDVYEELDLFDVVECDVTVSIKDGMVIGYSVKANASGNLSDKVEGIVEYNFDYTAKIEATIALTDIGTTDVSKKANGDIKKAIQKQKDYEDKYKDSNN